MATKNIYLSGSVRTLIGRFGGMLASWTAADLGVVMSEDGLRRSGAKPQARIIDYEIAGVAPEIMGIGPVPALRAVLARQNLRLSDYRPG